jgi:hypothetical protein
MHAARLRDGELLDKACGVGLVVGQQVGKRQDGQGQAALELEIFPKGEALHGVDKEAAAQIVRAFLEVEEGAAGGENLQSRKSVGQAL